MPTEAVFALRLLASVGFAVIAVQLWLLDDRTTSVLATATGAMYFYFSFQIPGIEGWPSLFLVFLLSRIAYVLIRGGVTWR